MHTILAATPTLILRRFEHGPDERCNGIDEEPCDDLAVSFVESGGFGLGIARHDWMMTEGSAFVSVPERLHRYAHVHNDAPSDVCVTAVFRGALAEHGYLAKQTVIPRSNRLAYLRGRIDHVAPDVMALESWAGEVVGAIHDGRPSGKLYKTAQLRWYARRIDDARRMLDTQFAEELSLTSIAREVAMSPFHFARLFRELTGDPPHRYLLRVRLAHAKTLLRDGVPVTDACYACGFANLSHFTRTFRRNTGVSPSSFARKRK